MKLTLRYGRTGMPIDIPDDLDVQVLRLNPLPPLENDAAALEDSLRAPIGCASLDRLARGRESACIVISDVTRPVPNEKILTALLSCLHDSGIHEDKITILVATGLHRPNEGPELEEMIGARIEKKYRVVNHVARDRSTQTPIGEVPMGLNGHTAHVAINNVYLRSDLRITTGLIEPHLMAGYSGGRKLVCPGIASAETIMQFHSPPMIGHPRAYAGNIEENPVHHMSRAVAGVAGMDFICNVTLSEEREITGVFSGDIDAAHMAGITHVDQQTKVPCEPSEIVITTSAGYPLDTTLYQAVKGMLGAMPAIKQGGTMILAASLSEGLGGHEFAEMCRNLTSVDDFMGRIYNTAVVIDQWQLQEMMQVLQKCEVMVVTDGVSAETLRGCLLTPMPGIKDALAAALKKHGNDAKITVIPEGPYVTPAPHTSD
ncbi:MAG: nickel-dependent lactate racemase [Armatimonadota bacterium]|nr:nickel-dependent lactate racemase [Armatimonadota bacterium]